MSIWPILILGLLSAFFWWRWDSVQRLFDPARRRSKELSNKDELVRSLDALIDFLSKQEQFRWVGILRGIRTDLQTQSTEAQALSRLSDTFGGMGSLNDLVSDGAGADQEGGRLLDSVFRDMKLYHGTPENRAEWRKLEAEHKGEPPARIKHAFRQE
jgi:hypothetical protein